MYEIGFSSGGHFVFIQMSQQRGREIIWGIFLDFWTHTYLHAKIANRYYQLHYQDKYQLSEINIVNFVRILASKGLN